MRFMFIYVPTVEHPCIYPRFLMVCGTISTRTCTTVDDEATVERGPMLPSRIPVVTT
jgi:hypothetical protein